MGTILPFVSCDQMKLYDEKTGKQNKRVHRYNIKSSLSDQTLNSPANATTMK